MKTWILAMMILSAYSGLSQTFTVSEQVSRSFVTGTNTEVSLTTKYSRIVIEPSPDDSLRISVGISVTDKNQTEAQEQLDEIDILFSQTGYLIQAVTVFNGNPNDFRTDVKLFAGSVFNTSKSVSITFHIQIPDHLSLSISNAYGSLLMPDYAGSLRLNLDGSDFSAGKLIGKSTLNISGSKAQCRYIADGIITSDMTEWTIDSAGNVFCDSRGSQFSIRHADVFTIDSRRDKWVIGQVGQLSGSGNFSSFSVSLLLNDINLKTFYGNASVLNTDTSFHSINLISSYTDISLALPAGHVPALQCDVRKTRVLFPARMELKTDTIDSKTSQFRYYNAISGGNSFINLNLTGGSMNMF